MPAILEEPEVVTMSDLLERLGGIPPERVRIKPLPGTATEQDVIEIHDREDRLFELVDGVLVEKAMGYLESVLAMCIGRLLGDYMEEAHRGLVAGEAGMMRLSKGLVRIPDVSVVLWERLPDHRIPRQPILDLAPDLAVEVLSDSNTAAEIDRKLREYFASGCRCAWIVDPKARTVRIHESPTDFHIVAADELVTAESVLPGFAVSVADIFRKAEID